MPKCSVCDDTGKYRKFKDRDPYEGYKLAPIYTCDCKAGKKLSKIQTVLVDDGKILHIHQNGKIYEFKTGRVKLLDQE